jgi:hypothetical protein
MNKMAEHDRETPSALELRSRALFQDSVKRLDMPTLSRLTQARYAALEAAARSGRAGRLWGMPRWMPALGTGAALALVAALWLGPQRPSANDAMSFEDLEIVAFTESGASEAGVGDEIELLQEDAEFYDWAEKVS